MTNNINRILVLAPHTDDGEFGWGGVLPSLFNKVKTCSMLPFLRLKILFPEIFLKILIIVERSNKNIGINPNQNQYDRNLLDKNSIVRTEFKRSNL